MKLMMIFQILGHFMKQRQAEIPGLSNPPLISTTFINTKRQLSSVHHGAAQQDQRGASSRPPPPPPPLPPPSLNSDYKPASSKSVAILSMDWVSEAVFFVIFFFFLQQESLGQQSIRGGVIEGAVRGRRSGPPESCY